jgi:glutamate racemase
VKSLSKKYVSEVFNVVEIICSPPKQLIILECTHYPSMEALARIIAVVISSGESVIIKWAEGVAFIYTLLQPTTEDLMNEFLKGRVYWSDVIYAEMPEYKQTIRVGTFDIPVIDVSPNRLLCDTTKWMKKQA